jgi:hypothetical protein
MDDGTMAERKGVSATRRVIKQGLRLNILVLALDLAILAIYSLLQGRAFLALLTGGSLEFLLLLEAGILLLSGSAYVMTSGIFFGKVREQLFHSGGWSQEEYRRSEGRALPWVVAGALALAESLVLALL